MDFVNLFVSDASLMLRTFKKDDLAYPVLILSWILMLCFPLRMVDRRDFTTFLTYLAFFLSTAAIFFIALPDLTKGQTYTIQRNILLFVTITNIVCIRWFITGADATETATKTMKEFADE